MVVMLMQHIHNCGMLEAIDLNQLGEVTIWNTFWKMQTKIW